MPGVQETLVDAVVVNMRHSELTGIPKEMMIGKRIQDMVQSGVFDVVLNPRIVESGGAVFKCAKPL